MLVKNDNYSYEELKGYNLWKYFRRKLWVHYNALRREGGGSLRLYIKDILMKQIASSFSYIKL